MRLRRLAAVAVLTSCALLAPLQADGEAENAPAPTDLEVECSVPGFHIMPAFVGIDLQFERAGKALLEKNDQAGNFELALLTSGCGLETILPAGTTERPSSFMTATSRGDVLYNSGSGGWVVKRAGSSPAPLPPPPDLGDDSWAVTLSDDGSAVVWSMWEKQTDGARRHLLKVRDLASGAEKAIPLQISSHAEFDLFAANVAEDEYALGEYPKRLVVVDGDGAMKWEAKEVTGIESITTSLGFRRVGDGWVAWGSPSDQDVQRIVWSTPAGRHDFPLQWIDSVSVTPDGSKIAVSTSSNSRLNDNGAVVILRTSDGKQLFHRSLPRFTRVHLGFLHDTHLAINTTDGVDVVRVPSSMPALHSSAIPKPIDIEEKSMEYFQNLARTFGLSVEDPAPDSASVLVGTWRLADIGAAKGCGAGDRTIEVHSDGHAYGRFLGYRLPLGIVSVGEHSIRISEPDSKQGVAIFAMSGGFYVPSEECVLHKLERVP